MARTAHSLWVLLLLFALAALAAAQNKTENVILITLDGVRSQEIFGGLDLDILKSLTKKGPVEQNAQAGKPVARLFSGVNKHSM